MATALDLRGLAELADWRVASGWARGRCPACDSRTAAWGAIKPDGSVRVGCFACGNWRAIREHLRLDGGPGLPPLVFARPEPQTGRTKSLDMEADAEALDAVYRRFLAQLAMGPRERERVLGQRRGIDAAIRDRMSPLLRCPGREAAARLARDLPNAAPFEVLRRVPEISGRKRESLVVLAGQRGARYLEPWMDQQGRIVALRGYHGRREQKYKTSPGRWGPLLHFAFGVDRDRAADVPWVFTEGWMKAEVAAHDLNVVAVAFAGVHQKAAWRRALQIKQELAPDAPTYIAYDSEWWTTRPDIACVALELAQLVFWRERRCAGFAAWDAEVVDGKPDPKGIDDAIVAGKEVRLVDRLEFGALLGNAVQRWENEHAA